MVVMLSSLNKSQSKISLCHHVRAKIDFSEIKMSYDFR